jgi:hypothetical protein
MKDDGPRSGPTQTPACIHFREKVPSPPAARATRATVTVQDLEGLTEALNRP